MRIFSLILLGFCVPLFIYVAYLDRVVVAQFEGKRFSIPAKVYARPLEFFVGQNISAAQVREELGQLNYVSKERVTSAGEFQQRGSQFEIVTRPFIFWDGEQAAQHITVDIDNGRVSRLRTSTAATELNLARLEPITIGGIYPNQGEDRVLVRLEQVPPQLINALIATEDRRFFQHHGVDPKAVLRAFSTLFSGDRVQGGSTLTQQLVKNFFLTQERKVRRKLKEMVMAILLEIHFGKEEILETYINEVYFGQDKNRAIHGFGLASEFYFSRNIEYLDIHQAALLVGLLKGPAYYNPRRHPERALKRRNLVLAAMASEQFITADTFTKVSQRKLDITPLPNRGQSLYPAFMDLVIRQLKRDYKESDLRSEGLRIFTTLNPHTQKLAERALSSRLDDLEKSKKLPANHLNGAVILANVPDGEVSAVVGGREAQYQGFNRALDASRQIGSLIKPAIYLTALAQPEKYHLATAIDDEPFVWQEPGIEDWQPQNYDKKFHGEVPLWQALAKSYNVSAARLGTELGINNVMATVRRLGVEHELPNYASGLLGTVHLTPIEVAQMYHTIASGGFRTPFRAIREVTTMDGAPLNRYNLTTEPAIPPTANFLLVKALQRVAVDGTGAALKHYLPASLGIAGKTGTTDNLRDSWFAGFSGDVVAVVWIGNDESKPTQLTGASGALTVWGEFMKSLPLHSVDMPTPADVKLAAVNTTNGLLAVEDCRNTFELPFHEKSLPQDGNYCGAQVPSKIKSWFKNLLGN